jgi:hypothetical protein
VKVLQAGGLIQFRRAIVLAERGWGARTSAQAIRNHLSHAVVSHRRGEVVAVVSARLLAAGKPGLPRCPAEGTSAAEEQQAISKGPVDSCGRALNHHGVALLPHCSSHSMRASLLAGTVHLAQLAKEAEAGSPGNQEASAQRQQQRGGLHGGLRLVGVAGKSGNESKSE